MQVDNGTVISQELIGQDVYRLVIGTAIAEEVKCGQFVQVQVPGFFLRRPISVSEKLDEHTIVLVYKKVGSGTEKMTSLKKGDDINLFGPLGTGFPVLNKDVVLIGGGVGVPPLVETAKCYRATGQKVTAVLGFNTERDQILVHRLESLGVKTVIATMDGSYGTKGTVIDAMRDNSIDTSFVLACGPLPMLKAVTETCTSGYISLEARMACGMGACMGCVVKNAEGDSLRVCKDGPVFEIGKVVL